MQCVEFCSISQWGCRLQTTDPPPTTIKGQFNHHASWTALAQCVSCCSFDITIGYWFIRIYWTLHKSTGGNNCNSPSTKHRDVLHKSSGDRSVPRNRKSTVKKNRKSLPLCLSHTCAQSRTHTHTLRVCCWHDVGLTVVWGCI